MVAALAIGAAFFYGLSMVFIRAGLRHANTLSGLLICLVSCLVASSIIFVFTLSFDQFAPRAVFFFVLAGISGPFIARFFFFVGINRVGSAITAALYGTKTLFATITAVLILSERLTPSIALGTFVIIVGSIVIGLEESGGELEKEWSKKDLIYPIAAAGCFGISYIFRKMGLNVTPEPVMGVTIQNATALVCFPLLALGQSNRQRLVLKDTRAWIFFSLSGLSMVVAQLCLFQALDWGQVVVVGPLSSISPFFVFLLVGIFLRGTERITWKLVAGAALIVAGTTVLTTMPSG